MTTEDDARLLEQIRATPDDDQPRLVYADALLARGDERGEYITLAIASSRDHTKVTPEQAARLSELQKREGAARAKELGCEPLFITWERGFPCAIHTNDQTVVAHLDAIRRLPIRRLGLSVTDALPRLAAAPELAMIDTLSIHGQVGRVGQQLVLQPIPHDQLAALCTSNPTRLRHLALGDNALTDDTAALLATAPWVAHLEALELRSLAGLGLERLLAGNFSRLRALTIANAHLGERGGAAFARVVFPALEALRLHEARLGAGTRIALDTPCFASVQRLSISNDDARGLGPMPHLHALRELKFESALLDDADAIAIATGGEPWEHLAELALPRNQIGDAGAAALAASQRFPRLAQLDLDKNLLTRTGAMAFVRRTGVPALATLKLSGNPLPTGETTEVTYYDQDAAVSSEVQQVAYSLDEIRRWFDGTGVQIT